MPSWRFSTSSRNRDSLANRLPRYSDLSQPLSPDAQSSSDGTDGGLENTDSVSITSFGSQATLPAYAATADLLSRLSIISPSMTTLSRPPQYSSGIPQNGDELDESLDSGYTFPISSGFKSRPWATLRLYDAGAPTASRVPRKGRRHPRFSNMEKIIGSVELSLNHSQTIRSVELILKGTLITGLGEDCASVSFLDHSYKLWDRNFGDPQTLTSGRPPTTRYDGKLSGDWTFPFAIPFPTYVDLSTQQAVHATGSEGPIRFLPEFQDPTVTPFQVGVLPRRAESRLYESPGGSEAVNPFDISRPYNPAGKCKLGSAAPTSWPSLDAVGPVAPILNLQQRTAPTTPLLEPYTANNHERNGSEHGDHKTKPRSNPPRQLPDGFGGSAGATDPTKDRCHQRATCVLDPQLSDTSHALPQSFLEREVMANIHYELRLVVTHGKFTPTQSCAKSTIVYEPITLPPPMPLDRQTSLCRKAIPCSPNLDPNIWKTLSSTWMKGVYLDQHEVAVQCTLHLALPLSYARGTLVPCALTIACENPDALKFFANPRTPRVRLKRLAWFPQNPDVSISSGDWVPVVERTVGFLGAYQPVRPKIFDGNRELIKRSKPKSSFKKKDDLSVSHVEPFMTGVEAEGPDDEDPLGMERPSHEQVIGEGAVWCTPEHYTQEAQVKRLYGEIHLPKGLQPTCTFPLFKILYRLELLAPASGAFVPDASPTTSQGSRNDEHVYACCFVEITTETRGDEPRPVPLVGSLARPMSNRAPNNARRSQSQYWARYGLM